MNIKTFSCNLTDYESSFQSRFSLTSGSSSTTASQSCQSNEVLIGCTGGIEDNSWGIGKGNVGFFNGVYVGDTQIYTGDSSKVFNTSDRCTANGGTYNIPVFDGNEVYAAARCYDISTIDDGYQLKCVSVWGDASDSNPSGQSTASCPNGEYFMTSCSAYSPTASIVSYLVNDVSQKCVAEAEEDHGHSPFDDDDLVYANAVWLSHPPFISSQIDRTTLHFYYYLHDYNIYKY